LQGHFGDTPRDRRRAQLREMYHFDCACPACVSDYPVAKDLPKSYEEALAGTGSLPADKIRDLDAKHAEIGQKILDAVEVNDLTKIQVIIIIKVIIIIQVIIIIEVIIIIQVIIIKQVIIII
jgi:hypothetical protein